MSIRHPLKGSFIAVATGLLSIVAAPSYGSGFFLIEQSVSSMGNAYAGAAAAAEDASTIFFNPAGMTRLSGSQLSAGGHFVAPQSDYKDGGSTTSVLVGGGLPLGTNESGDAGDNALVPHFYFSHQLSDRLWVGIGVGAPFGLSTSYENDWIGRYHGVDSELETLNIQPSIAFKVNERVSIGAGINIQRADAELSNAIDFGTIDAVGGFSPLIAPGSFGLTPTASDGFVKVQGDDISFGFNAGVLVQLNDNTRAGLHYRSSTKHTLEGKAKFTVPTGSGIDAVTGAFTNTGVKATARFPDIVSASVFHQVNSEWAVMADVTWTNWSTLDELRFEFDNALQPDGVTTLGWEDTYRYGVGVTHSPVGKWKYRAGIAFDETPVPNSTLRTPRVPDEDRTWVTLGASYEYSDDYSVDVGYAHLFVSDPKLNKAAGAPGSEDFVRGNLVGEYDASVDIISIQGNWKIR